MYEYCCIFLTYHVLIIYVLCIFVYFFRAVTMHDRPAKMFADLDVAGRHKLFWKLDIFQ